MILLWLIISAFALNVQSSGAPLQVRGQYAFYTKDGKRDSVKTDLLMDSIDRIKDVKQRYLLRDKLYKAIKERK